MRSFVFLAIAALAIAGGAGIYYFRFRVVKDNSAQPEILRTVHPEKRTMATTINATGSLRLRSGAEVRVGAQLSGIVTKLGVTVGMRVEKGEVIAEIEARGLDTRIEQAQAQMAWDEAALQKTRRELERSRQLAADGLVPRQQLEDTQADLRMAEAKLEKSKKDLAVVQSDLPYMQVRAPISGVVSSISTQQGETVAASFAAPTFATILQENALELIAMVDETDIGNVRRGDPVHFTVESYPDRDYKGSVVRVAPAGTILSGVVNYEVTIRIADGSGLKPDMTANVNITTAETNVLTVPSEAVQRRGGAPFVYVRGTERLDRRTVAVGATLAGYAEIRSGLSAKDLVAVTLLRAESGGKSSD